MLGIYWLVVRDERYLGLVVRWGSQGWAIYWLVVRWVVKESDFVVMLSLPLNWKNCFGWLLSFTDRQSGSLFPPFWSLDSNSWDKKRLLFPSQAFSSLWLAFFGLYPGFWIRKRGRGEESLPHYDFKHTRYECHYSQQQDQYLNGSRLWHLPIRSFNPHLFRSIDNTEFFNYMSYFS